MAASGSSSSFFDKAKELARDASGKAKETVTENADKIDEAIDKAAEFAHTKTKGKYARHVYRAQKAAHGAVDKIADKRSGGGAEGSGGTGGPDGDDRPPSPS